VTIPDEVLQSAHISEAELKTEIAATLFQQDRLTLGQAAALANMSQLDFQRLLAIRGIPIHYGPEQLEHDLQRVQELSSP
jgi:predicted HTH domain antitoxin